MLILVRKRIDILREDVDSRLPNIGRTREGRAVEDLERMMFMCRGALVFSSVEVFGGGEQSQALLGLVGWRRDV